MVAPHHFKLIFVHCNIPSLDGHGSPEARAAMDSSSEPQARRRGLLIVDEIYQGLTYGVEASTVLSQPALNAADDLFVVNSFSKYFAMTVANWLGGSCP